MSIERHAGQQQLVCDCGISQKRSYQADEFDVMVSDARANAEKSWRKNKGPMAVYWKGTGAWAAHLYRAVRL